MKKLIFILSVALLVSSCGSDKQLSPVQCVNPFIGTDAHGHTFPGATVPFGLVQLSPDTGTEGWDWCSGYHSSDNSIIGFSHSHLSGTGGSDLGDILFMPAMTPEFQSGTKEEPENGYRSTFNHDLEKAEAGYYSVYLDKPKAMVELTSTIHTGVHRYAFDQSGSRYVIVDLAHGISDSPIDAYINKISDTEVEGYRRSSGWADDHTVYFYAEFSEPIKNLSISADGNKLENMAKGEKVVSAIQFYDSVSVIEARVGISYVDTEGAKNNLLAETSGKTFDDIRNQASNAWSDALSSVEVYGPADRREIFYTALYHSMIAPYCMSDVDGRYRSSDRSVRSSAEKNYGLFSTWDTFRALHPLMTIVAPEKNVEFVKSLIRYYNESGRLPVWDLNMRENFCMIGYHSIPIITDAYFKGEKFDIENAFEAMLHSATEDSYQGLGLYRHFHYMPRDLMSNSVSKALEFAYDDWCIAMVAKSLGKEDVYKEYIARAQYYKPHFDQGDTFMKGRDSQGRFRQDFTPTQISILGQNDFTEGNSWHYSFFAPQDVNTLIKLMGGDERFIEKLEELFNSRTVTDNASPDVSGMIGNYSQGNEPSHHTAYLYSYAGAQWRTAQRVNQICSEMYTTGRDGLCGNEDCGQMSAWYVLSAMGFYEVTPGSCIYILGSPQFDSVKIHGHEGADFILKANNRSSKNIYIQSILWNGEPYTKSYITHGMIAGGGIMEIEMTDKPNVDFGNDFYDRPVSTIPEKDKMTTAEILSSVVFNPYVDKEERFFKDSLVVTPKVEMNANIHYTTNGMEPTVKSPKVSGPIVIYDDMILKLIAVTEDGKKSAVVTYNYYKGRLDGENVKVTFPETSKQYQGNGAKTLTDGLAGGITFGNGRWLAWNGGDITIEVEFPELHHISSVGVNILASVDSWISLPKSFSVEYDTANGRAIAGTTAINENVSKTEGNYHFSVNKIFDAKKIYIVFPKNTIPSWHRSHDKRAWIFLDEITVK